MKPQGRKTQKDALLFATVGGNSGLLATLAWALVEQRGLHVVEWHTVLLPRGAQHMQADLLSPGAGLDALHAMVGETTLPRAGLHQTVYRPKGAEADLPAARDEQHYVDCVLSAARLAVGAAGERPVVFALVAGRDRVMTLALTVVAQFVARPHDLIVDLRLDPPSVVAHGGYYLLSKRAPSRSPRVQVTLVDVPLPRLRGLLGGAPAERYADLLRLGQRAVDDAAPLELSIDLRSDHGPVHIAGQVVRFSPAEKLMLAAFAVAHLDPEGNGFMTWPAQPLPSGHPLTEVCQRVPWASVLQTAAIVHFHGGKVGFYPGKHSKPDANGRYNQIARGLSQLGHRVNQKLTAHAASLPERPRLGLVHERVGGEDGRWRVRLAGVQPHFIWPDTAPQQAIQPAAKSRKRLP